MNGQQHIRALAAVFSDAPWKTAVTGLFAVLLTIVFGSAGVGVLASFAVVVALVCGLVVRRWIKRNPGRLRSLLWAARAVMTFGPNITAEAAPVVGRVLGTWIPLMTRTRMYVDESRPDRSAVAFLNAMAGGGPQVIEIRDMPQISRVLCTPRHITIQASIPVGFDVEKFAGSAAAYAHAWRVSLVEVASTLPGFVDLRIPVGGDPLFEPIPQEAWQGLAGSPDLDRLPVAYDVERQVLNLDVTHTLFIGATGSGKGSGLWGIIRACLPAKRAGTLRFFAGIDPKRAEFADPDDAPGVSMVGLFDRVAFGEDEIVAVLGELRAEMDARVGGRSFTPSTERPWLILLIDEITSLFDGFGDAKNLKRAESDLRVILSQGRSKGVVVVGAGQEATKERLKLRDLFPQRVAFRLANSTETGLVLGDTAVEAGATPHLIPAATPSNHYASAGLAWVRTTEGTFTRCRFLYTDNAAIQQIATAFMQLRSIDEWRDENGEAS